MVYSSALSVGRPGGRNSYLRELPSKGGQQFIAGFLGARSMKGHTSQQKSEAGAKTFRDGATTRILCGETGRTGYFCRRIEERGMAWTYLWRNILDGSKICVLPGDSGSGIVFNSSGWAVSPN